MPVFAFRTQVNALLPTCDHDEIRRWADSNDAVPAEIRPRVFDGTPALLYFLFGDAKAGTDDIKPITWEDFFARFDLLELSMAFVDDAPNFVIARVEPSTPARLYD